MKSLGVLFRSLTRKTLILFLGVSILTTNVHAAGTGDGNDDGKIDISDALLTLKYVVGLIPHTGPNDDYYLATADVSPLDINEMPGGDGKVDISDALLVLKRVVNLINWPAATPKWVTTGAVWFMVKSGTETFMTPESNRSVSIAKYDATGNKLLEKPLLTAVAASDSFYCEKLLAPAFDNLHLYAICVKMDPRFIKWDWRSQGQVSLLKIRKDDLGIASSTVLFADGKLSGVENYLGESTFYVLVTVGAGSQYLVKFDFDGVDHWSQAMISASFGMTSLHVNPDVVFAGGIEMQSGSLGRLAVKKFSSDTGVMIWETHYRDCSDSTNSDYTSDGMLTFSSAGLFLSGTLDDFASLRGTGTTQYVLLRWDPTTGSITSLKSGTTTTFGKLVSDNTNLYIVSGNTICKMTADGTTVKTAPIAGDVKNELTKMQFEPLGRKFREARL